MAAQYVNAASKRMFIKWLHHAWGVDSNHNGFKGLVLLILYSLTYKDWTSICIWRDLSLISIISLILVTEVGQSWYTFYFGVVVMWLLQILCKNTVLSRLYKETLRNKQSGTTTHKLSGVHRHIAKQVCALLWQNVLLVYFGKTEYAFIFSKTMESTINNNQLIGVDKQNLAMHTQCSCSEYRNGVGPHKTATISDQD